MTQKHILIDLNPLLAESVIQQPILDLLLFLSKQFSCSFSFGFPDTSKELDANALLILDPKYASLYPHPILDQALIISFSAETDLNMLKADLLAKIQNNILYIQKQKPIESFLHPYTMRLPSNLIPLDSFSANYMLTVQQGARLRFVLRLFGAFKKSKWFFFKEWLFACMELKATTRNVKSFLNEIQLKEKQKNK